MATIELRPDFKTAGGETMDVRLDDIYAGTLFLLYREQVRMQGVFVIDQEAVSDDEIREQLEAYVERYVQHLGAAIGAHELEVSILAGDCSKIISLQSECGDTFDVGVSSCVSSYNNIMVDELNDASEEELLTNFDAELVPSPLQQARERFSFDDIQVLLARDDGDTLLYDVYSTASGSLPLGTATIDTNGEQLSGYIDFRIPGTSQDRDRAANAIMLELLKEQTFTVLHLNMMFHNEIIDECLLSARR